MEKDDKVVNLFQNRGEEQVPELPMIDPNDIDPMSVLLWVLNKKGIVTPEELIEGRVEFAKVVNEALAEAIKSGQTEIKVGDFTLRLAPIEMGGMEDE